MTQPEDRLGRQRNTIHGAGIVVTGGTITNSSLTVATADQKNRAVQDLRDELARVCQSLAAVADPTVDQQDALDAVNLLRDDIDRDQNPAPARLKRLRLQLTGLIAVLAPVGEVIGGVAALEEILRHLG